MTRNRRVGRISQTPRNHPIPWHTSRLQSGAARGHFRNEFLDGGTLRNGWKNGRVKETGREGEEEGRCERKSCRRGGNEFFISR